MIEPTESFPIEPRWIIALTILLVMGLVTALPDRVSLFPDWIPIVMGVAVIVPMIMLTLLNAKLRWLQIEGITLLVFCLLVGVGNFVNLSYLIDEIVEPSGKLSGLQLFTSSIALWITNVLTFSLLYWQIDRRSSEIRKHPRRLRSNWLFPQADLPDDAMPNWQPTFIDYLFLAFTTATAFSPTDALPLTTCAKMLMLLESIISLMTIAIVAARAINILGN